VTRVRIDAVGDTEEEVFAAIDAAVKLLAQLGEPRFKRSEVETTTRTRVPARGWKIFEFES
jgi:hypothetical protein